MKSFYEIYVSKIGLMALALLLSRCDFLDEDPDNRVALDDLGTARQLLVNAYSSASVNFTDWMTDDVEFTTGTTVRLSHQQIFAWEDVTTGPTEQDTPDFFWFQAFEAIAHANEVLTILESLPVDSEEDQALKRAVESEARLTRAYGHFMLVNLFGRHYDESESGSDLGIPYVKIPETEFLTGYERLSVADVYDEIEEDLLVGLDLVDDSFFENSGKYHFNRNAALAFASRFYLYKKDYASCIRYSDLLLGDDPGVFVKDLTSLEFRTAASSTIEYPRLYTSPDHASNLLLMRKISLVQRTDFAFGPENNNYRNLFGSTPFQGTTDQREDPAFTKGFSSVYPARYQSLFERNSLNSTVGTPYYIHIALSGEEVLLNRAEANVFLNNISAVEADLQAFSVKRYSDGDVELTTNLVRSLFGGSISTQGALLNYILIERQKEFIMQGMRWFDIRRYELEVNRTSGNGNFGTLEEDDRRKVLQIPTSAIEVGGLEANPR